MGTLVIVVCSIFFAIFLLAGALAPFIAKTEKVEGFIFNLSMEKYKMYISSSPTSCDFPMGICNDIPIDVNLYKVHLLVNNSEPISIEISKDLYDELKIGGKIKIEYTKNMFSVGPQAVSWELQG